MTLPHSDSHGKQISPGGRVIAADGTRWEIGILWVSAERHPFWHITFLILAVACLVAAAVGIISILTLPVLTRDEGSFMWQPYPIIAGAAIIVLALYPRLCRLLPWSAYARRVGDGRSRFDHRESAAVTLPGLSRKDILWAVRHSLEQGIWPEVVSPSQGATSRAEVAPQIAALSSPEDA